MSFRSTTMNIRTRNTLIRHRSSKARFRVMTFEIPSILERYQPSGLDLAVTATFRMRMDYLCEFFLLGAFALLYPSASEHTPVPLKPPGHQSALAKGSRLRVHEFRRQNSPPQRN